MKKINKFILLSLFAAVAVVAASSKSYAIPAFARQVGVSCSACHFQHFPELNAFGRAFKAGGYSQTGGTTTLIEDDNLSLPTVLNATFVIKLRDIKTNGSSGMGRDVALGQIDLPDEAAIIMAGRAGEHIGFLAEWTKDGAANLKVPIGWEVADGNIEVVPFTTDALGPQEGFELMNTGAVGSVRAFEDHVRAGSAARYLGLTDSAPGDISTVGAAATGLALVYANPLFFVNITPYAPYHGGAEVTSFANYVRAAVTPQVAGWDLGVGVQWWTGTYEGATKNGAGLSINTKQEANALIFDAQAMGQVGGMPLGVFLSNGRVPKQSIGAVASMYGGAEDATVTSISAELGVHPKATVGAAYRTGKNNAGKSDTAAELIGTYKLAQNMQIGLTYATMGGDANSGNDANGNAVATNEMMINMFAAF